MKTKHEKNIYIELSEDQKAEIKLKAAKCYVSAQKNLLDSSTPMTIDSALQLMSDAFESELAYITFKHMKELADKDEIINRLLKQVK